MEHFAALQVSRHGFAAARCCSFYVVVIGLMYKACLWLPATPAETKALPCEGALALVKLLQLAEVES